MTKIGPWMRWKMGDFWMVFDEDHREALEDGVRCAFVADDVAEEHLDLIVAAPDLLEAAECEEDAYTWDEIRMRRRDMGEAEFQARLKPIHDRWIGRLKRDFGWRNITGIRLHKLARKLRIAAIAKAREGS